MKLTVVAPQLATGTPASTLGGSAATPAPAKVVRLEYVTAAR